MVRSVGLVITSCPSKPLFYLRRIPADRASSYVREDGFAGPSRRLPMHLLFARLAGSMRCVPAGILFLCAAAPPAAATVMYYTGTEYTTAVAPWDLTMHIEGSITLSSPLAPNLTLQDVSPDIQSNGFTFTDGVNTYDPSNSPTIVAIFSTDATANITDWQFVILGPSTRVFVMSHEGGAHSDSVLPNLGSSILAGSSSPGTWSLFPVPEPTTLTLSAIGISVLCAATRRKRM